MVENESKRGITVFLVIWAGQLISLVGSGLSEFALGVWLYQHTQSVTQYALVNIFIFTPPIIITPLAGVMADRHSRRMLMLLSNLGGCLATLLLALLVFTNTLQPWLVYLITLLFAVCSATLFPAYSASIPMLVSKQQLGRANGMVQFATSVARTFAPLLAGFLLLVFGLQGIALIDGVTFLIALVTLLPVSIPQPAATGKTRQPILKAAFEGMRYITDRPGLSGLLLFFAIANISAGFYVALFTPLVLSFASTSALGFVTACGGAGLIAGSTIMTLWGGFKRHMHGVLGFGILFGLSLLLMGISPSIVLLGIASFILFFCQPIVNASNMAIWQAKIPPELQGRVLSSIRLTAWSSLPLAILIAGPLADHFFTPLLNQHGPLASSLGQVIGVGAGRGMGLMLMLIGVIPVIAGIIGYMRPQLRLLEDKIPDAKEDPTPEADKVS